MQLYGFELFYSFFIDMLREIVLATVLLCQHINAQSLGCQSNCQDLSYYTCHICYDSCPNGTQSGQNATVQYDFTLKQCTQTYCAYWGTYVVSSGNSTYVVTYCAQYNQRNLTQNDCIINCCDNPSYNKFTNQTFSQCVDRNNALKQKVILIWIIVGSVLGGILAIVILIMILSCCISNIKKCILDRCCPCLRRSVVSDQNPNPNIQIQPQQQSHISINKLSKISNSYLRKEKLLWADIDQMQLAIFQETCSICLNRNINCQTLCKHKFHLQCLKLWTGKSPSCPNCKSESFNDLKLYCMTCWKRQAKYHLKVQVYKEGQNLNLTCDYCNAKKLESKKMEDQT